MKLGTERAFGRTEVPELIVPGSTISTQQLPNNVLPRAGLRPQIEETGTNGVFGISKSGFMSLFKIGRRYGLSGRRQVAELSLLAEHVRHAAIQPTVRTHSAHIYEKLHVHCCGDVVAKAVCLAAFDWLKPSAPESLLMRPIGPNENTQCELPRTCCREGHAIGSFGLVLSQAFRSKLVLR